MFKNISNKKKPLKFHSFIISCLGCTSIASIELEVAFTTTDWSVLGELYACLTRGDFITDPLNRDISAISGNHTDSKTNNDVKAFAIAYSNCFYFPRNLEKFFINLEAISIGNSKLKEIRSEDLKPFPKLRSLGLAFNELQVLEPNLFQFNSKLEVIYLDRNNISHIDANIFDNFVGKLSYLYLTINTCGFENAFQDTQKANQLIAKIQNGSCKNEEKLKEFEAQGTFTYRKLEQMTKKMEKQIKELTLNLEAKIEAERKAVEEKMAKELMEVKEDFAKINTKVKELSLQILELKTNLSNVTTEII